jgi:hypothetical protein
LQILLKRNWPRFVIRIVVYGFELPISFNYKTT